MLKRYVSMNFLMFYNFNLILFYFTEEKTVTLSGNSYYGFNLTVRNDTRHTSSSKEQFKLKFKSGPSQKQGLLWYAWDSTRKIFLYLKVSSSDSLFTYVI